MTLVPAYGRDYKSKEAVLADWNDNKDFIINDISSRWDGKPANKQDIEGSGYLGYVNIRYQRLTKILVITNPMCYECGENSSNG